MRETAIEVDGKKVLYISHGVAHNVIPITSNYIYFKLLMILFSIQWCLLKAAFFWKTMLVVFYAKILHHSSISTVYEKFESVFLLV